ncbi:MAG TPA: DUF2272 domain-containing protein [Pseudoxanthomonas sp.]|nr:DUF2272 domain-containing protein [Pseudoxanthomonas sp.]
MLRLLTTVLAGLLALIAMLPARAADPCPLLRAQVAAPDVATRVAAYACKENQNWYSPFIDADGRGAGPSVYEAENAPLADGTEAWRKVALYWLEGGLAGAAGACADARSLQYPSSACRTFVIDTPWSGAFVSWVMRRAGVPGFRVSAGHIDYVRRAYREPSQSPYLVQAPLSGKPAPGDLLCSVRSAWRSYGYDDLAAILSAPDNDGLAMHCDIVVGAMRGGSAYLVGGNVQQTVILRQLKLDANGYFSGLPLRRAYDPECSPDLPAYCNANRQNWAVMLKLKPAAELARLAPPPAPVPSQPQAPERCATTASGIRICSTSPPAPPAAPADATP